MVPVWRFKFGSGLGSRSKLEPILWTVLVFSIVYLTLGIWLLPVLTDWVSSAVDEGYTSYAAQRIREGDWPHRDFFFLWTPATAYLHALLQAVGVGWVGERAASLVASWLSCVLVLRWAIDWKFSKGDLALLCALLLGWSFTLWNIPYSSWYSVLVALLAVRMLPNTLLMAGFLFGVSFWFKQNVGILSLMGAIAWLLMERRSRDLHRIVLPFALVMILPFFAMLIFGGMEASLQAFRQIFLFPLRYPALMGTAPSKHQIATPLTAFGLWIVSLFFLRSRASQRSASLLQFGLLIYIGVYAFSKSLSFLHGSFMLLSVIAWPFSLFVKIFTVSKAELRTFLMFWLPGIGIFLQVFPRLDFQHFLFVFPLSALLLVHSFAVLRQRYDFLAAGWVRLPVLLLAMGGVFLQSQVVRSSTTGQEDPLGRVSSGAAFRLSEEVAAVRRFLLKEGLKEGGPILVLPNATSVYRWTGFRNPTPHQQFFPGYVEAYGTKQEEVLTLYRKQGGKYLVVQQRSGLELNAPEIYSQIETEYEVLRMFPEHFTIYVPRSHQP